MKYSLVRLACVFPLAFLLACGGPLDYRVRSSNVAPGGDAHITADVNRETNTTKLVVDVTNLTPADRIEAEKGHFVLWQRKNSEKPWVRVGGLDFDAEAREGHFEGSVPEVVFELIISAEKNLDSASPSTHIVFSQNVAE